MVVVAGAVEIGWHGGVVEQAVLGAVVLAHFETGDLGDGVGFIGDFERRGQEAVFRHGLGSHFWIDAGGAEEENAGNSSAAGALDEVCGDGEVFVDEVCGIGRVRMDAAHLCRCDDDRVGLALGEIIENRLLAGEIEFGAGGGEDVVAERFGLADEGGTNHAAMAGNKD